jgi:hypothetical protein
MQKRYGKDGLVALSVNLDPPGDANARAEAEKFLASQKPPFASYMLNVKPEVSLKKLNVDGVPCIYVFNRDGRIAKKLPVYNAEREPVEEVDFAVIEKVVQENLKKK